VNSWRLSALARKNGPHRGIFMVSGCAKLVSDCGSFFPSPGEAVCRPRLRHYEPRWIFAESGQEGLVLFTEGRSSKKPKMSRHERKSRRGIRLAMLACLAVSCICGCGRRVRTQHPMDFVPPEADVITLLDCDKFVKSSLFGGFFDISELRRTLLQIGVSPENLLTVAGFVVGSTEVFAAPRQTETPSENLLVGVIVEGKGSLRQVFKVLSEQGWVRRQYEGRKMWVRQESAGQTAPVASRSELYPAAWGAVASLRPNILVAGTPSAVRRVLDVARGKTGQVGVGGGQSSSGTVGSAAVRLPAASIVRRVGGGGQITVAVSFSQEMRMAARELARSAGMFGGMVGGNMLEGVLEVLGIGRGVGLSFSSAKDKIAVRVVFVAKDPASAKVIAGLVSMAKIMIPTVRDFGGADAAELARGVHVWSEQNLVLLDFKIPESVFGDMTDR